MADSQLGPANQEDENRLTFQTKWKQKWDRIVDIRPHLRVSNDEEKLKIWSELGVISGEFYPNT